jgi:hypothetical protein
VAAFGAGAQFGDRLAVHAVLRGDEAGQVLRHAREMVAIALDATPGSADALTDEEEDGA